MKKVVLLLAVLVVLATCKASANDSCTILFNKQLVFKGLVEQPGALGYIKRKDLKSADRITIIYHSESTSRGWNRTFYIQDSAGENVKTVQLAKQSGSVTIDAAFLQALKKKGEPLFINTISLPVDKAMAARIRVRTLFICKIQWS